MGKLMTKYLLAFLLALATVDVVYAAETKFTNVRVSGTLTVDGASTQTGNVTQAGTLTRTAATTLSTTTFTGGFIPWQRTLAQINALTSGTTGQIVGCSNCVMSAVCVSSGTTAAGQWTVISATATAALGGTLQHCQ